jgi:fumarylacetoacetate (FAA) hydrolase family protein
VLAFVGYAAAMAERFERHRQAWTAEEVRKLHLLAGKGMALKALARALTRSEESIRDRAKADGLRIAKLRSMVPERWGGTASAPPPPPDARVA